MAKPNGLDAVARDHELQAAPRRPASEQMPLLPEAAAPPAAERSGPGRPPGSQSRRTEDFVRYLTARGLKLPGVWLAEQLTTPVAELLATLGLDDTADNRRWCYERQQDGAKALMPYVHQRQAVAVDVTQQRTVELRVFVNDGELGEQDDDGEIKVIEGNVIDMAAEQAKSKG